MRPRSEESYVAPPFIDWELRSECFYPRKNDEKNFSEKFFNEIHPNTSAIISFENSVNYRVSLMGSDSNPPF